MKRKPKGGLPSNTVCPMPFSGSRRICRSLNRMVSSETRFYRLAPNVKDKTVDFLNTSCDITWYDYGYIHGAAYWTAAISKQADSFNPFHLRA